MTNPTPPPPTPPPGPTSTSGGHAAPPPIDWRSLVDEFSKLGQEVVKRFSDKASDNADLVRHSHYTRKEWLDDVKWFWTNAATDAARVSEIFKTKLPSS